MTNSTQSAHLNVGCIAQLSLSLSGRLLQMTNSTQSAHLNVGCIAQLSLSLSGRLLQMTNSTQRAHLNVGGIARSFRGLSVESQVGQLASSAGSKLHIETHAAP